jgi:2-polyprenyl-3-methyl-5-hydroxy-6-metoxy-1,4-benzoquinol methylase
MIDTQIEKFISCNLCGSDDFSILYQAGEAQISQIVKCNKCKLMYANPRKKNEDHVDIEAGDPELILKRIYSGDLQKRVLKEEIQVNDYKKTKLYLQNQFPNQGKLLEVGSGFGYLLKYFKEDGWEVTGVEPSVALCRYAEEKNKINTISTVLEDSEIETGSIDVVLMMHVIEHVPDPQSTFQEVYRILKPGGIFIIETPCYDSLMFKLLGKRERSINCDGHIYFFTADTLTQMANKSHLKLEKLERVGRTLTFDRLLYNVGVISKSKIFLTFLSKISHKFHLNKLVFSLNFRDMQRLYLRKED